MAFADPQSITVNAVAKTLNKVKPGETQTEYATEDDVFRLKLGHQVGKERTRRLVRVDQTVVAADPLTAENDYARLGVYLVVDQPNFGFSAAEVNYLAQALAAWCSSANILKLLSGQH